MSVDFETPAARVIASFKGKDSEQFRIPVDLPDITFLRALSIQGRLRYFQQTVTNAAPLNIIPTNGETLFVFRVITSLSSAGTLQILNDGQTRYSTATSSSIPVIINLMDSLVGNGVKVFSVIVSGGSQVVSLFAWVENTSRIRDVTI